MSLIGTLKLPLVKFSMTMFKILKDKTLTKKTSLEVEDLNGERLRTSKMLEERSQLMTRKFFRKILHTLLESYMRKL